MISPDVVCAYQIESVCLCKILQVINEELKHVEKEMNRITHAHRIGKYFKTLPGAGNVLACKLYPLLFDIEGVPSLVSEIEQNLLAVVRFFIYNEHLGLGGIVLSASI